MVRSFRQKGLRTLFETGSSARVRPDLLGRSLVCLHALNKASKPSDLRLPGLNLHRLRGKPLRYSIAVNGPWRITFEWEDGDAWRVDLEQYH